MAVAQVPDRGGELGGLSRKKEFHRALAKVALGYITDRCSNGSAD
jgi:hypothetical protein